mmetsp:Transcript_61989/g.147708  ORF Transcript_61989/g.147708 Transcript_61989/m.147708 type:complete len:392 (-) Transcript_61989:1115-2290(-)
MHCLRASMFSRGANFSRAATRKWWRLSGGFRQSSHAFSSTTSTSYRIVKMFARRSGGCCSSCEISCISKSANAWSHSFSMYVLSSTLRFSSASFSFTAVGSARSSASGFAAASPAAPPASWHACRTTIPAMHRETSRSTSARPTAESIHAISSSSDAPAATMAATFARTCGSGISLSREFVSMNFASSVTPKSGSETPDDDQLARASWTPSRSTVSFNTSPRNFPAYPDSFQYLSPTLLSHAHEYSPLFSPPTTSCAATRGADGKSMIMSSRISRYSSDPPSTSFLLSVLASTRSPRSFTSGAVCLGFSTDISKHLNATCGKHSLLPISVSVIVTSVNSLISTYSSSVDTIRFSIWSLVALGFSSTAGGAFPPGPPAPPGPPGPPRCCCCP